MFFAYLKDRRAWEAVLTHSIWRKSLDWLEMQAAYASLGDYPLGEAGWFANVHTYTTLPEKECIWESHAETVDVQYVIHGEEGTRWLPSSQLGSPLRHLADRDRLEWQHPTQTTTLLTMRTGMFAIFMPGEVHCPMIAIESAKPIRKVVVKIPLRLLTELQQ